MRVRLFVSSIFSYLALKTAPSELKPVLNTIPALLKGLRNELANGRDGGVAIIPWSTSQRGKDLSQVQAYAAGEAVDKVRADWVKTGAAAS